MALSWRLSSVAGRLTGRARDSICRRLSTSATRPGTVVPFELSDIGEGIRDVIVKEWFVKPGDRVRQFDEICEVQSDKASVTITSRYDGFVKALHFKPNDVALVGASLMDIEVEDDDARSDGDQPETRNGLMDEVTSGAARKVGSAEKVLTTPAVRRIAKERNVTLKDVIASGKKGRILKEDVLAHLERISANSTETKATSLHATGTTIPVKKYAKHMWSTMTQSLSIPHFVYSDECIVDGVMRYRQEAKDSLKEQGVSLTLMPFFIKAASLALARCPELNAWLDEEKQTLRIFDSHNIGIAMDTPEGLVVPNIKNVQNLSVVAIARELNRLQELGGKASIPLADLTGTTFSLSNIGVVGGTYTKPVILSPQVAIGAFGKAQRLPRFDDLGHLVSARVMSISWAADHRVLDGVTVAKFSNLWKYYVENPARLLIGG